MKREINFYQTDFKPFTAKSLVPNFNYSKNVQGWFFIRDWTFEIFRYAFTISVTLISDMNEDRNLAHTKNVCKYMLQ